MPAKGMGVVLKDIERKIIESREMTFQGKHYKLDEMSSEELEQLAYAILAQGRKEHRPKEGQALFGHRLRHVQAKSIRAILRERKEQIL